MWVELREEFLDQRLCQVEALKCLFALQKGLELVESELLGVFSSVAEAFVDAGVLLGHDETNLLDDGEFPVESARVVETAAERACHVLADTLNVRLCVGVRIRHKTLEI